MGNTSTTYLNNNWNMNTFALNYKSYLSVHTNTVEEQEKLIQELIIPESNLERAIVSDIEYRKGLFWGTPRYGHPEGKIIFHIREVLDNIDRIPNLSASDRSTLRLICILHDTFKYKEYDARLIHGRIPESHHSYFASNFSKKYTSNPSLHQLILLHDEAYYCWQLHKQHQFVECQIRLDKLLSLLGDDLQLFYLFFKCDTKTGDKNQEPLLWFEKSISGIQFSPF